MTKREETKRNLLICQPVLHEKSTASDIIDHKQATGFYKECSDLVKAENQRD